MGRPKFSLSSDQLELLLAFEKAEGLGQLAEMMARDPSVISRNLQRIAEDFPVLEKIKGRWELTSLGAEINEKTKAYLEAHTKLLAGQNRRKPAASAFTQDSVLVIINAQKGLLDSTQEGRSNSEAEKNIARLLEHWRARGRRVVHVKHISDRAGSAFFRGSPGCEFLDEIAPRDREAVMEKTKSSAFAGTDLTGVLKENCANIVLAGFTANECIDATARDAAAMDYSAFVAEDAVATFDLREPSGKLIRADKVQRLTMANINAFYAKVMKTDEILADCAKT